MKEYEIYSEPELLPHKSSASVLSAIPCMETQSHDNAKGLFDRGRESESEIELFSFYRMEPFDIDR